MSNIVRNKQAQYRLIQKLASYFKVNKELLKGEDYENQNHPLISFPYLEEHVSFHGNIYCTQVERVNIGAFWDGKKFIKSNVYNEFILGESAVNTDLRDNSYFMTLHVGSILWIVRRIAHYDGIGGIAVFSSDAGRFAIEPIGNYLLAFYPREEA